MRFLPGNAFSLACFIILVANVCSHFLTNELFKVKLHIVGQTLGAASATGFAGGLLAGAAYLHHKKYHNRDVTNLIHSKKRPIIEPKEEQKLTKEMKWVVRNHGNSGSHEPIVKIHQVEHHIVHHDDFGHENNLHGWADDHNESLW